MSETLRECTNPAPSKPSNPFKGIITTEFHTAFTNLIDAALEDGGLSTPCKLIFKGARIISCNNCVGNIYKPDGPFPFSRGMICPACQGKKQEAQDACDISMCMNTDSRKWMILSRPAIVESRTTSKPKVFAETVCRIEMYPKIRACDYAVLDTSNENYALNKYKRMGEPEPCGLGNMEYIVTAWERIE